MAPIVVSEAWRSPAEFCATRDLRERLIALRAGRKLPGCGERRAEFTRLKLRLEESRVVGGSDAAVYCDGGQYGRCHDRDKKSRLEFRLYPAAGA